MLHRRMTSFVTAILLAGCLTAVAQNKPEVGAQERDGTMSFSGMVLPGKTEGTFRLRGRFGTLAIRLSEDTVLGYECFRSLNFDKRQIKVWFMGFSIPAIAEQTIEKDLPCDLYVKKTYHPADQAQRQWQKEIDAGEIRFIEGIYTTALGLHVPNEQEPYFSAKIEGVVDPSAKHKKYYAFADGRKVAFGLGTYPFVWGLISRDEIKPYATEAKVFGHREGGIVMARRVAILPVGEAVQYEDKRLARYMFIGDSISVGYNGELQGLLPEELRSGHFQAEEHRRRTDLRDNDTCGQGSSPRR